MTTHILDQIVGWSEGRPSWQRDALRRLFQGGVLSEADITELTHICRRDAGLDVPPDLPAARHLEAGEVAGHGAGTAAVTLGSIGNVTNFNALAPDACLSFAPAGLSVVYGDNGAGKSGYARILKHACRARGELGRVLPDVFDNAVTGQPGADISYSVGPAASTFSWAQHKARPDALRDVSVFDSGTATVYVDDETDVAFRPFGLDVFPKLAQACDRLRASLQSELAGLGGDRSFPDLVGEHPVGKAIAALASQSAVETISALASLNPDEQRRLAELRRLVASLDADAPERRAAEARHRVARMVSLRDRLTAIVRALSGERRSALRDMRQALIVATEAATLARAEAAGYRPDWSIGSAAWQQLWNAAARYAEEIVPREGGFFDPAVDTECVLCKSPLTPEAQARLGSFAAFASHEALRAEAEAAKGLEQAIASVRTLAITHADDGPLFDELASVDSVVAHQVQAFLAQATLLRDTVVSALEGGRALPEASLGVPDSLSSLISHQTTDLGQLAAAAEPATARELRDELTALAARERLQALLPEVLDERARRLRRRAIATAMKQVETAGITTKNTELTKAGVTDQLRQRFQAELNRLELRHVKVSVEPKHGAKGITYHQVRFTSAATQGFSTSDVLSEGEQRCVALAGFLAELSTQPSLSAVVFDDPVSSLDHERRSLVAARLVEEAKARQVIVFTHDLVFLLFLEEECKRQKTLWHAAYLTHRGTKRGVPIDGLPWYGQPLKKRIGWLRQQVQQLAADAKSADTEQVELRASLLWGRLREAWECGVEETLLGGAVRRFSRKVATQQLKYVSDITATDVAAVDAGMTLASTWMPGHDLSAAINQPMPPLDVLAAEVEKLDSWRGAIEARRK